MIIADDSNNMKFAIKFLTALFYFQLNKGIDYYYVDPEDNNYYDYHEDDDYDDYYDDEIAEFDIANLNDLPSIDYREDSNDPLDDVPF